MSEPELEFEIDEFGCIRYRVTNEGALLSKDEKEFIIDYVTRMQTENAKLRELCAGLLTGYECGYGELCKGCEWDGIGDSKTFSCLPRVKARDLGVEVDG